MIVFPNCKINLGLNILRKRADGYHDLETCFLPIKLRDALEIIPSENNTHLTTTGLSAGNDADNLCMKAYYLLKKDYPQISNINVHLHKAIPSGAGLGGGSSDASFILQLLNTIFNLKLSFTQLNLYALQLGSDCPFFLINKTCIASGRGEILEEINLLFQDYKIALVNPGIHISTATAFQNIQPKIPSKKIKEIITKPINTWKNDLKNDFEEYVFEKYPDVKKIKEDLYNTGALYAAMSGSGSSVFGIFNKEKEIAYVPKSEYYYKIAEPYVL